MSAGSHVQRSLPFRGMGQSRRGTSGDGTASRASRASTTDDDGDDNEYPPIDADELEGRKRKVSDFFSSFEEAVLPWEWADRENLDRQITLVEAGLDESNWTVKEDYILSSIKRACYDVRGVGLEFFGAMKAPRELSTVLLQKLLNRMEMHFDAYEAGRVNAEDTAEALQDLAEEGEEDRVWRSDQDHDRDLWRRYLSVLNAVSKAVRAPRTAAASPAGPENPSFERTLFYELFVVEHDVDFMLSTLEGVELNSLDSATRSKGRELGGGILGQLEHFGAQPEYRARLERIFSRPTTP